MAQLPDTIQTQCASVVGLTPNVASYVNPSTFLPSMAKRHLLGWPNRRSFGKAVLSLTVLLDGLKARYRGFGMPPTEPSAHDSIGGVIKAAEGAVTGGLFIVKLIAALSTLFESTGTEQHNDAMSLKADMSLPAPVRAELQKLTERPGKRARVA